MLAFLIAGCSGGACNNEVVSGKPSPDGAAIAFVFYRRCAAPAQLTTNVSVVPFQESLHDGPGNTLIAPGEQPVKVIWENPAALLVTGFANPTSRQVHPRASITAEFRYNR